MGGQFLVFMQRRQIVQVHRVGTPFHLHDGGAVEEFGESPCVQRSGADHQLQVRPPVQQELEISKQKVDVQAAFVSLVQDQGMVLAQVRIMLSFRQQDAVRHEFQTRIRSRLFFKPHLVPHQAAQFAAQFFRHTAGDGSRGEPSGLGAAHSARPVSDKFHSHFGKLGGFAGTRFPDHHHDLMLPQDRQNVIPAAGDGKVRISDVHGRKGEKNPARPSCRV